MIYLLDTHYLLWSLFEPDQIPGTVRAVLEDEQSTKMVSGVNLWEISFKYALGKLDLGGATPNELFDVLLEAGFDVIALDNHLLASYYQLPHKENHSDPFDRLLIWQAITNGYTLLTEDKKIAQYEADGLAVIVG